MSHLSASWWHSLWPPGGFPQRLENHQMLQNATPRRNPSWSRTRLRSAGTSAVPPQNIPFGLLAAKGSSHSRLPCSSQHGTRRASAPNPAGRCAPRPAGVCGRSRWLGPWLRRLPKGCASQWPLLHEHSLLPQRVARHCGTEAGSLMPSSDIAARLRQHHPCKPLRSEVSPPHRSLVQCQHPPRTRMPTPRGARYKQQSVEVSSHPWWWH
mmetsp:Transcript_13117/g.28869  ORF Transcript_13117/g.28869 Transcript_13117/m.28869 type:complete len:210 (-) Transcript_13117:236-865(-)